MNPLIAAMAAAPAASSPPHDPAAVVAWEVDLAGGGTIVYSSGAPALFGHASLPGSLARFALVTEWVHEDDLDTLLGLLERALDDGTLAAEFRVRGADARWRWIELRGALLRDDAGRARRALGVAQDVTARRDAAHGDALLVQLDEALRGLETPAAQAQAASRLLAGALGVDCVLWAEIDADQDHGVVLGAHPWPAPGLDERLRLSHFGPELHEAARSARVLVHHDTDAADAADVPAFRALQARAGLLVPRHEGGRLVAVLAAWQAAPRRWREAEVMLARRVAERCGEAVARTRAQLALRESEQRFRELADSTPLLVWIGDPPGGVRFANRAFRDFFGLDEAAVSGRWRALVHPDDARAHDAAFRAAAAEGRPFHGEARMRRADGQWRWVESWAVPRECDGMRGAGMVGCSLDITERRRAEQALRDADRRKDDFLATLAHELRNPLAPMAHALDLLGRRGTAQDSRALRDMMRRQVRQTARLVDDLLEVSRIARGKLALRRAPVQLATLLRDAIETSRPLIESAHHTLEVSVPREPLWLDADAQRLTQVLCNLLNNAAKYTEPGGTLVLDARRQGDEIVIAVRDDGIGLSAALLPRVFDMFTQGERVTHRAQGGLGIGLALARRMVELHGGRITAESPGLNQGSTFTVTLALSAPPVAAARPLVAAEPVPPRIAGRVLVADDNRDAADALAALLRIAHAEVEVVYDGLSALAAFERAVPGAVVADVGMPGLDGYELAQRLRQLPGGERVLLVALTGWGQEGDRRRSERAGFDHHLVKPADFDALLALLAAGRASALSAREGTARPAP